MQGTLSINQSISQCVCCHRNRTGGHADNVMTMSTSEICKSCSICHVLQRVYNQPPMPNLLNQPRLPHVGIQLSSSHGSGHVSNVSGLAAVAITGPRMRTVCTGSFIQRSDISNRSMKHNSLHLHLRLTALVAWPSSKKSSQRAGSLLGLQSEQSVLSDVYLRCLRFKPRKYDSSGRNVPRPAGTFRPGTAT